jgi:glycosyltransferase involved in cell wall biosynthesis
MITPYLPYPLHSGGQIRSYNLIKNLSKKHQITLFSFMKHINQDEIDQMKKFCKKIYIFKRRKAFSLQNIILAGLSPFPFLVSIYLSLHLNYKLRQELKREKYDLIHAETFYVMPNIPNTSVPILLVEQTIEYQVYAHFVQQFKNVLLKPILKFDVLKIKFWESYYWKKAKMVIAMSDKDKKQMLALALGLKVEIVPNGVDTSHFANFKKQNKDKLVLFVGNFSWLQNREAVYFLINKIWPEIKRQVADAKLLIVGQNPPAKIKNLAKGKDIVVDAKTADIREIYSQASVLLAPIFGPGGTRFKILEAMASQLPVVTTKVGIEGIPVQNNIHILIGSSASELAQSTVKILKDNNLSQKLSENAIMLIKENFDWQSVSAKLGRIYKQVGYAKN